MIRDTKLTIEYTYNFLIDFCRYLLISEFLLIVIGEFTKDYLENEFERLNQYSGVRYYITMYNVIQSFHREYLNYFLTLHIMDWLSQKNSTVDFLFHLK